METDTQELNSVAYTPNPLRGYDFPVPLRTLQIGDRFVSFSDNACIGCADEIWYGTVLWQSPGSVEIWWDHDPQPTRCQPELDVWLWDDHPIFSDPEWIEYWFNVSPVTQPTAPTTDTLTTDSQTVEPEGTLTDGN